MRAALVACALLVACSSPPAPTTTVTSPTGFSPALRVSVPQGWTSAHRGDDGFDLVGPDVVVAVVTPPEATAAEALSVLRDRLGGSAVTGYVGGLPAQGLQLDGGSGPLLESPAGTVVLTRTAGTPARVLALDLDDAPLLVAVVGDQRAAEVVLVSLARDATTR